VTFLLTTAAFSSLIVVWLFFCNFLLSCSVFLSSVAHFIFVSSYALRVVFVFGCLSYRGGFSRFRCSIEFIVFGCLSAVILSSCTQLKRVFVTLWRKKMHAKATSIEAVVLQELITICP
jgi:hypothetical protein